MDDGLQSAHVRRCDAEEPQIWPGGWQSGPPPAAPHPAGSGRWGLNLLLKQRQMRFENVGHHLIICQSGGDPKGIQPLLPQSFGVTMFARAPSTAQSRSRFILLQYRPCRAAGNAAFGRRGKCWRWIFSRRCSHSSARVSENTPIAAREPQDIYCACDICLGPNQPRPFGKASRVIRRS
jgi:hypothetical protein